MTKKAFFDILKNSKTLCPVDTSVLIALFRKNTDAKTALDSLGANDANKKDFDFIQDISIHNSSK